MVTRLPQVAIVGRPNVGKSTLFNRMSGSRRAIVDSVAGSTRDRNVGVVDWSGKTIEIVDTGGILESAATPIDTQVAAQVEIAIRDAALVCWVVGIAGAITRDRFQHETALAIDAVSLRLRREATRESRSLAMRPGRDVVTRSQCAAYEGRT